MTAFHYCPVCWPLDLGEHACGRCLDCHTLVLAATPGQQIELLREQNQALAGALRQAMEVLKANGIGHQRRAGLRLVHILSPNP